MVLMVLAALGTAGVVAGPAPAAAAKAVPQPKLLPKLLVETAGTNGDALYPWPQFPSSIAVQSNATISGLRWGEHSASGARAAGMLRVDLCPKSCTRPRLRSMRVSLQASRPRSCPVTAYETKDHETYKYQLRVLVYSRLVGTPLQKAALPKGTAKLLALSPGCPSHLPASRWPPPAHRARGEALAWSVPMNLATAPGTQLVACQGPDNCTVVGAGTSANKAVRWDGTTWSGPAPLARKGAQVTSLSCTARTGCVAADSAGDVMTSGAKGWSAPRRVDPHGDLKSVSCSPSGFCAAVDARGHAVTYNGRAWSRPSRVDRAGGLASVSCPTAKFCAASDATGHVLTFDGRSWSGPRLVDRGEAVLSMSCPTARFCVATDSLGRVLTWRGSRWSAPEYIGVGLSGVDAYGAPLACASPRWCVLVDEVGNAFTYNGRSWSGPQGIESVLGALSSVSCPSAAFCVAVNNGPHAIVGRAARRR
ncbi:MAG: hypothetical protein ACRDZX_03040 [Acidimicrobiales bacterium]